MKNSIQEALYDHFNKRLDGRKGRRIEAAEIEREEVTNTLSKDRFGNIDEFSRSALLKSYNAHAIAANSAARYNFEQDQQCRSSGTHPNEWRINDANECDDEDDSDLPSSNEDENKNIQRKRSSEGELKQEAFSRSIPSILVDHKCSGNCPQRGECMKQLKLYDILKEMRFFWGDIESPAPTSSQRKAKIISIMSKSVFKIECNSARSTLKQKGDENVDFQSSIQLMFKVTSTDICEAAYLKVIGHPNTKLWLRCKREILASFSTNHGVLNDKDLERINAAISKQKYCSEQRSTPKKDDALSFIKYFANFHADLSPQDGEENVRILPFETVSQLFAEYKAHCKQFATPHSHTAAKETFRKAWKDCYKKGEVKFTRGKGTFPTCDICNNANDMLALAKNNSRWTRRQRDIIVAFKMHHLKQQAAERAALEAKKLAARMEYSVDGSRPKFAVIFGDGMTKYATQTPKYARKKGKKETAFLENRVFGVEVHCGPIVGEILVHSDEFVRGGANFTIEVHRLVLIELARLLKEANLFMPEEIHFQLDNCGENKNKEFFMYCSILVEKGAFTTITVGFLIIGHTHASIDQYFSCLRKKIRKAAFIASPISLQHLFSLPSPFSESKRSVFRVPLSQLQLTFVHDYKAALAPYYNKAITNYNIPYQFKFTLVLGKCICQTKMFSDPLLPWLPKKPAGVENSIENLLRSQIVHIANTHSLSTDCGRSDLNGFLGLPDRIDPAASVGTSTNKEQLETLLALNEVLPQLKELENNANNEQQLRHLDEANGFDEVERYELDEEQHRNALRLTQHSLQSLNTASTGYLFWIDYMVDATKSIPPLITLVKPTPINPLKIWRERYSDELAANLLEAETRAMDHIIELERNESELFSARNKDDTLIGEFSSDDESVFGEMVERVTERKQQQIGAVNNGKKRKKQSAIGGKTDIQFIVNAIANTKSAVRYMLDSKINSNVVAVSRLSLKDLTYEEIYQRKTVSDEDMQYFTGRQTTEAILGRIDLAIRCNPSFEWLPKNVLSEEQIRQMELKQVELAEQSTAAHEYCSKILTRRRESTEREVVTRINNEAQLRAEAKHLNAQAKAAAKLIEKEAKSEERKKRAADAKAANKKQPADSKRAVKKKTARKVALQASAHDDDSSDETIVEVGTSGQAVEVAAKIEERRFVADEIGCVKEVADTTALGYVDKFTGLFDDFFAATTGETLVGISDAEEAVEMEPVMSTAGKKPVEVEAIDEVAEASILLNKSITIESGTKASNYNEAITVTQLIGRRNRDEYTIQQLTLGRKVKDILLRTLRRVQHKQATVNLNPSSRRTTSINDFSESLLQEFSEINSTFYKQSYSALPDIFDVFLEGNSNSASYTTEKERKVFLSKLSAALYNKFKYLDIKTIEVSVENII